MTRLCDILLASIGLLVCSPLFLILLFAGYLDTGKPIFLQQRLGRYQKPFTLIKFRTMALETQSVATHLVRSEAVTHFGYWLRSAKLDELPQLFNVLKGDMSIVGPRPCLLNQTELIRARERYKIFKVKPGITGLAQIIEIDMSTPELLAKTESRMLASYSWVSYIKCILHTLTGKGFGDRVKTADCE